MGEDLFWTIAGGCGSSFGVKSLACACSFISDSFQYSKDRIGRQVLRKCRDH